MLKKVGKCIFYNTESKHYHIKFTFQKYKQINIVAKIKTNDGVIRYAENKEEAKLAINQYIANGGSIDRIILKENKTFLSDCIKEYINHCNIVGKSRSDLIEKYCNYFLDFLKDYYKKSDILAGEIIPNDFYKYMSYRQSCKIITRTKDGEKWTGRYVSNSTINREMNSIKGLFKYLKKIAKVLKENPCEDLEDLKIISKVKQPPTPEQEEKILQLAATDYDFFVMLVMFDTLGTRMNEVLSLLWENVHLESTNIFPNGFIDFVKRKNNKNLRLPLSAELQTLLKELPRLSEYVFTNPKTGTRYTNRYKKLNTILKEANVKELGIGYHIFRHNTAASLEQNGVEVSTIKDILGNSTNVVLSTYLNQGVKRKQEVINLNSIKIRKYVKSQEKIFFRQNLDKNRKIEKPLKIAKG